MDKKFRLNNRITTSIDNAQVMRRRPLAYILALAICRLAAVLRLLAAVETSSSTLKEIFRQDLSTVEQNNLHIFRRFNVLCEIINTLQAIAERDFRVTHINRPSNSAHKP